MDELNAQIAMLDALIADIDTTLRNMTAEDIDLPDALTCRSILHAEGLALIKERLDSLIGDALGTFKQIVPGIGEVKRHRKARRTDWQSDDLLRVVLDTRIVDPATGEIESDVQKIRRVWNLAGYSARRGALKELGVNPDDFCVVQEQRGWTIEVR